MAVIPRVRPLGRCAASTGALFLVVCLPLA